MITLQQAYDRGVRASLNQSDSDVSAERFTARHCTHGKHSLCLHESAWWDGYGDGPGNPSRRPPHIPQSGAQQA